MVVNVGDAGSAFTTGVLEEAVRVRRGDSKI
jgi:hypothetical protein